MVSFFVSASVSVSGAVSLMQPPSLKHLSTRENIHVYPSHTERQQLQNYPLATRCLHHFVRAVSKGFEPIREGKMVTYHGHRRSCG
ncbi:hypothetical protein EV702DRAFT_1116096 [Suillus placidus]|uniref:Uncharacterized protein n=1 Tax=Suillus placidus TaxID=48579 RepID=A0A9P6ZTP8_9AGAM|nr:hypothetical protein EV702DRAFT_1116096 [Suillus placidus]